MSALSPQLSNAPSLHRQFHVPDIRDANLLPASDVVPTFLGNLEEAAGTDDSEYQISEISEIMG